MKQIYAIVSKIKRSPHFLWRSRRTWRIRVLYGIFYLILGLLSFGLALWSGMEVRKAWKGKIPYYINDVALNGKLDSIDAAMLSNLIRLRVVEISEDLRKTLEDLKENLTTTPQGKSLDQNDGLVKKFGSAGTRSEEKEEKVVRMPPLGEVVNYLGDLKLNIAGLDLSSILTSLQNMLTGSRTLRFSVTKSDHDVTVSGDISIFDPNDPFLKLAIPTDQSSGEAFAFQIADKTAWEIVRHQFAKKKAVAEEGEEFRTDFSALTTDARTCRNPSLKEAKLQIEAQMDYAFDYLTELYKRVPESALRPPAKRPKLRLIPEDVRDATFAKIGEETFYDAPPMVRFIPDKTFGQMALLFLYELKNRVSRPIAGSGSPNEESAIFDSYVDIFGAVVNKQLLGEDKGGGRWPSIQIGGKNWHDGADLSILVGKDSSLKPLRSLREPGSGEGDCQVARFSLHVEKNDVVNGVHQNSGILNKAFYEASQKIGVEKAAEIWLLGLQKATKELQHKPLEIESLAKEISSVAGSVAGYSKAEVDEALKSVGLGNG